jgi:hypothetical protein
MPWIMDIRFRQLVVDLTPGLASEDWDELLDHIIQELPNVDRVLLLVPAEYEVGERGLLLDVLVQVLTRRAVNVERRYVEP